MTNEEIAEELANLAFFSRVTDEGTLGLVTLAQKEYDAVLAAIEIVRNAR